MFSKHILTKIEQQLVECLQRDVEIKFVQPVSGGDINDAYCIRTNQDKYFIKTNNASRFPKMFEKEANGLNALRKTNTIKIPEVITFGEMEHASYLLLEWIESSVPQNNFWGNFGKQLAQLHQNTNDCFGFNENNYIGSLNQSNKLYTNWIDFFINERLQFQVDLAINTDKMDATTVAQFENLYKELPSIFPEEPPALLHGDLWSGNYMAGNQGEPIIMDPAVYYGHREMDLAMTKLFGGFNNRMYEAYHQQYPLEKGWESRIPICNLYPLLVHVNLFGGGYLQQVKNIVNQF